MCPDFAHLQQTFNQQAREHPDLMEPYITLLGQSDNQEDQRRVMWRGLRETFRQRYPSSM